MDQEELVVDLMKKVEETQDLERAKVLAKLITNHYLELLKRVNDYLGELEKEEYEVNKNRYDIN